MPDVVQCNYTFSLFAYWLIGFASFDCNLPGLHGYSCTLELRNQRNTLWSEKFSSIFCRDEGLGMILISL